VPVLSGNIAAGRIAKKAKPGRIAPAGPNISLSVAPQAAATPTPTGQETPVPPRPQ
jgi:hypothetical protein